MNNKYSKLNNNNDYGYEEDNFVPETNGLFDGAECYEENNVQNVHRPRHKEYTEEMKYDMYQNNFNNNFQEQDIDNDFQNINYTKRRSKTNQRKMKEVKGKRYKNNKGSGFMVLKIGAIMIVVIIIILFAIYFNYKNKLKPVKEGSKQEIRFVVGNGWVAKNIAEELKNKNLIKDVNAFNWYVRLNGIGTLKSGRYKATQGMSVPEIIQMIENGDVNKDEAKITFIEGIELRKIIAKIAENLTATEEDVLNILKNETYLDSLIAKYSFLSAEIKSSEIYNPLEGYLFPDTYIFDNKEVPPQQVFEVMLNRMGQILKKYENEINNHDLSLHEILTLASIVEKESAKGTDRKEVAGLFMNRLKQNMSLGSDPTTYYGLGIDITERNLTREEMYTYNPYNTRGPNMEGKLPPGPICSPSEESIDAVINYNNTDSLYFVSDKTGKIYFTKTYEEHNALIAKLKSEGNWFDHS